MPALGNEGLNERTLLGHGAPNASKASSSSAVNDGPSRDASVPGEAEGEEPDGPAPFGDESLRSGWGSSEMAVLIVRSALSSSADLVCSCSIFFLRSSTSATACLHHATVQLNPPSSLQKELTSFLSLP